MAKKEDGPDRARSWAICMAGYVINTLLSGISRTTGQFYVSLIETYGISRMEANMPFTLRNVVRSFTGPIAGAIGQRYGARDVTIAGGILACLGISLCCLAPNAIWISVLWGGIHGTGVALGNTLYPVIINQYFSKYRATASGLSHSGACVGSFLLPFVIEYMLRNFGLPGTFLITGGLILNVLPASLLMVEPSWIKNNPAIKQQSVSGKDTEKLKRSSPIPSLEENREEVVKVSSSNLNKLSSSEELSGEKKTAEGNVLPVTKIATIFNQKGIDNPTFVGSKSNISERDHDLIQEDTLDIPMRTFSIADSSIILPNPLSSEVQETSIIKGMTIMMSNPMFYVIGISFAGFAMLYDPALTVIVDYITDKGFLENDAKYFISIISLGDLLGRLCFGWVTDKKYLTLSKFMILLQVIQGICFLLLPLFQAFYVLIAIIMIYGLASGATLVMYPILVSTYLASVQSLAMGNVSLFSGVLSFAIPPLIGYFRDNAGSYDGMFVITGSLSVMTGCLWLIEPHFARLQKSRRSVSFTLNT